MGASRRTAEYQTLYAHSMERWYQKQKAEDLIFKNNALMQVLASRKETGAWGAEVLQPILDSKNPTVESYEYYDTLNTAAARGRRVARFVPANYNGAITISQQEMIENKEPNKVADRVQFHVEQAELTMAERIDLDAKKGNTTRATNLVGLEQAIPAFTDLGALGSHTARYQYRQATNTYGGVTRSAMTGIEAGGTGWETLAVDFNFANRFGYSSGAPNTALTELRHLYTHCSQGTIKPDLILMSFQPFDDFESSGEEKMQIRRESAAFGDLTLGFDNLKYKSAIVIYDETATTQNATGAIGDCTYGEQNVYLLNTRFMRFLVEEEMDFELGEELTPTNQRAFTRHMGFRGLIMLTNPRYFGRIYAYGTTPS